MKLPSVGPHDTFFHRFVGLQLKFLILTFFTLGGIHSTPVSRNFSFEITSKLQVIVVRFGGDAVVNCKTNDPSANVTLQMAHPKPSINVPVEEGKISRNGSVFTIHNIIVHDGGKYHCVAEKSGQVIRREILLTIDTSMY